MNNNYQFFLNVCDSMKVERPVQEFKFHQTRKWRFDFAWPDKKIALEVEGGVFTNGRHTRASGFLKDMEKYNNAALLGWRIIRTTPQKIYAFETIKMIKTITANG
jgi:very-short-patch-repair endonuclease